MLIITRCERKKLEYKDMVKDYDKTYQVMVNMNKYANRPSALPFLAYIPEKNLDSIAC